MLILKLNCKLLIFYCAQGRIEALGTYQELNSGGVDIAKTLQEEDGELLPDNLTRSFSESELEGSFTRNGSISMSSIRKRNGSTSSKSSVKEVNFIIFLLFNTPYKKYPSSINYNYFTRRKMRSQ